MDLLCVPVAATLHQLKRSHERCASGALVSVGIARALCAEGAGAVCEGFPHARRGVEARAAAQRAIFFVQRELEAVADSTDPAIVLCDRGLVSRSQEVGGGAFRLTKFITSAISAITSSR